MYNNGIGLQAIQKLKQQAAEISREHRESVSKTNYYDNQNGSRLHRNPSGKIFNVSNPSSLSDDIHRPQDSRGGSSLNKDGEEGSRFFEWSRENTNFGIYEEERGQLLKWGRELYEELKNLEKEHLQTQRQLEASKESNLSLEKANQKLLQRCLDTEKLLRDRLPSSEDPDIVDIVGQTTEGGLFGQLRQESRDLRSQLETYSATVDMIQAENQALRNEIKSLEETTEKAIHERDEREKLMQEADSLVREYERRCENLMQSVETLSEQRDSLDHGLKMKQDEIALLRHTIHRMEEDETALRTKFENTDSMNHNSLADLMNSRDAIRRLKQCYHSLLEQHRGLISDFDDYVRNVSNQVQKARPGLALNHSIICSFAMNASEWIAKDDLDIKVDQMLQNRAVALDDALKELALSRAKEAELSQRLKMFADSLRNSNRDGSTRIVPKIASFPTHVKNICKDQRLFKFQAGSHNRKGEIRYCHVSPDLKFLRWGIRPRAFNKQIPLNLVSSLTYGMEARELLDISTRLQHPPYWIFRIKVAERDLVFRCENDDQIENWVLGLSTLCGNQFLRGAPFTKRSNFLQERIKLKIFSKAEQRRVPISQLVKEAVQRTVMQGNMFPNEPVQAGNIHKSRSNGQHNNHINDNNNTNNNANNDEYGNILMLQSDPNEEERANNEQINDNVHEETHHQHFGNHKNTDSEIQGQVPQAINPSNLNI